MGDPRERLTGIIARFIALTVKRLPGDVTARLETLRSEEDSPLGRAVYGAMFDNLDKAAALSRPCCQDTGVLQFFARAGAAFPLLDRLEDCLREAAGRATRQVPLRPNAVEYFDERNTGDNTGTRVPWLDWEITGGGGLDLYLYLAGGGCSLPGFARTLMPLEGYEGAIRAITDQITNYGVNACPPLLAGIGLGGSVDVAAKLSKKALLRPLGSRNPHPRAAELEERLEAALDRAGLGPGGFSGRRSVMAVHIEQAARHTATIAVALSIGCWAHRRSHIRFTKDLEWELISHKGAEL